MAQPEPIEDAVADAPMLDHGDVDKLLLAREAPCISIYVPTSPITDRKDKNRILYKDQVRKVVVELECRGTDKDVLTSLVSQLESVGVHEDFWMYQQYGLAVLLSPKRFVVRRLMHSPEDIGCVADRFHLRPLLRETGHWMRYQVLCVDLHEVALYDCDREHTTQVRLHPDVPRGMGEALDHAGNAADRGDLQRAGDDSKHLRQYFQRVEQAIREHHNGRTDRPLILAAAAEHQGLFREVSRNPNLLKEGLDRQPFQEAERNRLGDAAAAIVERALTGRIDEWIERYRSLEANGQGVTALDAVARAAAVGQIDTVLIDDEARIEGRVDPADGAVYQGEEDDGVTDDVLDDIAELALAHGGSVRFLPSGRMPDGASAAALLRYQAGIDKRVV